MLHTIARVFEKRATAKSDWSGRIGHIEAKFDVKSATLDGKDLPDNSVVYLLNFAFQSLQDAYAGAESMDEAQANWGKKRNALIEGTIGQRGAGVDEETRVRRLVAEAAFIKKYGAEHADVKALATMTDDDWAAKFDAIFEKNAVALQPRVDARRAELKRMREAKAAEKIELAKIGELDL